MKKQLLLFAVLATVVTTSAGNSSLYMAPDEEVASTAYYLF